MLSINAQTVSFNNTEVNIAGRDQIRYGTVHDRRKMTDWLSPLNFKSSQGEFLQTREQGTGNWLLESPTFQEWRNGVAQTLWCPGDPGAGKTILASIVVDHLQTFFKDENVGIVFAYCNYKEQTTQTVAHLIASLLKQLVQHRPAISETVKSFYDQHQDQNTYPTRDELVRVLGAEIKTYAKAFIVVDALDECTESHESRVKLLKALRSITGPVNLMVTSRNLPSIEHHFRGARRLDIRASDDDVGKYIQSRLADYPDLVNLRETIKNQIVSNSRGMFLLASLHMNALLEQDSEEAVLDALDNLPNEIDQFYDEAMERIEQQTNTRDLAKRVLSWIIYASRPLSVEELRHAVAISPTMTKMDPRTPVFESKLASVCAGLVVIDKEQHVVRLAHYSAQQYFENQRESRFPNAEATIAATCLTYLSFDVFACGFCRDDDEFESLLKENALLHYAARNWGHHARQHQGSIKNLAIDFFRDDSKVGCASQVMLVSPRPWRGYSQSFPIHFSGIHISAYYGLEQIVRCQLESGVDSNHADGNMRTPLFYAAQYGHEGVVRLLLAWDGVEVDLKDEYGQSPLSRAADHGHGAVVKLLLARDDVQADSRSLSGRSPLSYAAGGGHDGVVELLLTRDDVEADSKSSSDKTPLSYAAANGHDTVVNLLLARDDVEADSRDSDGQTPLRHAAYHGHDGVVKVLLARNDVEVNSENWYGRTALSYAAHGGHDAVVKRLLARDDIKADSSSGDRTPLSYAARSGRDAVVSLLLSRDDVEADSKCQCGRSPLSYAADGGHVGVVKLLLARDDVEVNSKDLDSRTPVSYAADGGHVGAVKLLLARDEVKVNSKDLDGRTPLLYAAYGGHDVIVKLLLARDDIEVDWKDLDGRLPVSYAIDRGHATVVKLLNDHVI